jgi:ClpP class serine protease
MQLSPHIEEGDPAGGDLVKPIRVELKGPIKASQIEAAVRLIEEEKNKGANFLCLWIDSPGGSPMESMRLASYLTGLNRDTIRTVAYIPNEARADAAFAAMACDQIVMHSRAILGGPGQYQMRTKEEIAQYRSTLSKSLAHRKNKSW